MWSGVVMYGHMWSCVLICGQVCRWFGQVGWRWRLRVGCRRRGRSRRAGGDSFQSCFDWQHDDVVLTDHVLIDSIAWVTDLNLLALKTRHGWRQVFPKVFGKCFGKFLKTQHCWQTGASEKFFLLGIFEDSYCSWWVGELVGSKLVSNIITWTSSFQVTEFHKTKHASFGQWIRLCYSIWSYCYRRSDFGLSEDSQDLNLITSIHFMGGCDISGMFVSLRYWDFL